MALTNRSKEFVRLTVTPSTQKMVREDCWALFVENNPEFEKVEISDDLIVDRIAKAYLERL